MVKRQGCKEFAGKCRLDVGEVLVRRQSFPLVEPAELFHPVPAQDKLASAESFGAPAGRTRISTHQRSQVHISSWVHRRDRGKFCLRPGPGLTGRTPGLLPPPHPPSPTPPPPPPPPHPPAPH